MSSAVRPVTSVPRMLFSSAVSSRPRSVLLRPPGMIAGKSANLTREKIKKTRFIIRCRRSEKSRRTGPPARCAPDKSRVVGNDTTYFDFVPRVVLCFDFPGYRVNCSPARNVGLGGRRPTVRTAGQICRWLASLCRTRFRILGCISVP